MTSDRITEQAARLIAQHQPTTGMQVASGVTCRCGYWTGNEEPGRNRPVGLSGLMWHHANMLADAGLFTNEAPATPPDVLRDLRILATDLEDMRVNCHPVGTSMVARVRAIRDHAEAPATEDEAAGWERDDEWEKGQPNGLGEVEPNSEREWYTDERTTHQRRVITYTGPWREVTR